MAFAELLLTQASQNKGFVTACQYPNAETGCVVRVPISCEAQRTKLLYPYARN
jgi:hypothetical protein